jgi:hypothetical protein
MKKSPYFEGKKKIHMLSYLDNEVLLVEFYFTALAHSSCVDMVISSPPT